MSADNGVYILVTPHEDGDKEFRVNDLGAIDNVYDGPGKPIENAREMWAGCSVYRREVEALRAASGVLDGLTLCEYGISYVRLDDPFNPKMVINDSRGKGMAEVERRYKRKVIAAPEGRVVHHGDCEIFRVGICTCGLLAFVLFLPEYDKEVAYPGFYDEWTRHKGQIEKLWELQEEER